MSLYKLLLRTFLRLSVVGGLLPCYLQIDFANLNHSRNNFKLFSIFFPLTWWFTILLTAHFGYVALVINELVFFILDRLAENSEISLMMIIISVISDITLVVISFVPRLLVFRVTQLRSALISIGEFDQQFNKNYHKMCSTNTRLFTGALIIIAWVVSLNVLTYPIFEMLWVKWGTPLGVILLIIKCLIYLQTGTWFVFFHIFYYAIAFRINMLSWFLRCNNEYTEEKPEIPLQQVQVDGSNEKSVLLKANRSIKEVIESFPKKTQLADKMRKANFLFYHLCQAASELGTVFSLPILVVITCSFLTITSTLFFVIYNVSIISMFFHHAYIQLASCLLNVGIILSIFKATDLPVTEVTNLREVVMYFSSFSGDPDEKLEINSFILTLREDRVQSSAAGLFTVGMDLFPSLFGAVATYLIILLQTIAENAQVSCNRTSAANDSMIDQ